MPGIPLQRLTLNDNYSISPFTALHNARVA
jgi:hypothetical protein